MKTREGSVKAVLFCMPELRIFAELLCLSGPQFGCLPIVFLVCGRTSERTKRCTAVYIAFCKQDFSGVWFWNELDPVGSPTLLTASPASTLRSESAEPGIDEVKSQRISSSGSSQN